MGNKWRKVKFFRQFVKKIESEKGDMLVLSLLVTALFLTFSAGYLKLLVVEGDSTERTFHLNQALSAAESGVEEAIWEIKYNSNNFSGWTSEGDTYTKTANITDASGSTLGAYTVTVTGASTSSPTINSSGSALFKNATISESRDIEVTLNVPTGGSYNYAAFAEDSIYLYSNSCTDSFDSTQGPYDSVTNSDSNGDVGTNSTSGGSITLKSNAEVDGDAYAGETGDPDVVISTKKANDVTGETSAVDAAVTIDSVIGPTGLTNNGSTTYSGNQVISTSGEYVDFTVGTGGTVTISGDVQLYVTDEFVMRSNSDLIIAAGSSLELYVDGSIHLRSNTTVNNNTQDPSKLIIYGTDSMTDDGSDAGIRFHSNTDIYGIVQAKNSTVELNSNAEVFGTVMAHDVEVHSNSCIHYDENLGSGGGAGSGATVTFWHEK